MKYATMLCLMITLAGCATGPVSGWEETSLSSMTSVSQDAQAYFDEHPDSVLEAVAEAGAIAFVNADGVDVDVDARSKLAVVTMETVAKKVFDIRDLSKYIRQELKLNKLYSDAELTLGVLHAALKTQGEEK